MIYWEDQQLFPLFLLFFLQDEGEISSETTHFRNDAGSPRLVGVKEGNTFIIKFSDKIKI